MKGAPRGGGKKRIVENDLTYKNYNETLIAANKALQELPLKMTRGCMSTPYRTSKKKLVEALTWNMLLISQVFGRENSTNFEESTWRD